MTESKIVTIPSTEQTEDNKEEKDVKNRICDYYTSPRGCIKGKECDFLHPTAPNGNVTNKVCEYFNTPRGCVKSNTCDFLHVPKRNTVAMSAFGPVPIFKHFSSSSSSRSENQVCKYYMSTRGCIKGSSCEFLHPLCNQLNNTLNNKTAAKPVMKKNKVCSFYNTEAGCKKGNTCEFIHQKNTVCEFFNTPRGCRKGESCDFLHVKQEELASSSAS
eukprot:TRINITY_DN39_c0_g2_i2.p1 TRINITY_DN39_c0_g2~~TRINITY_DN39_c0_g2_i2.p1  ORF type:complete len:216 (+),score=36.08 TRINITY_DN39_c0_g2_i2:68-715(+)